MTPAIWSIINAQLCSYRNCEIILTQRRKVAKKEIFIHQITTENAIKKMDARESEKREDLNCFQVNYATEPLNYIAVSLCEKSTIL
jgi:hypothetical protein